MKNIKIYNIIRFIEEMSICNINKYAKLKKIKLIPLATLAFSLLIVVKFLNVIVTINVHK